jgi:hypothetical protein
MPDNYFGEEPEPMLALDALDALQECRDAYPALDAALSAGRHEQDGILDLDALAEAMLLKQVPPFRCSCCGIAAVDALAGETVCWRCLLCS